ncbi:MAG: 6-carboxytetrahydropterin synthase QueD [Desulfovibrionaceae bacterium]|nr:6-carboxytetrahydropterin synthase QueD [Desulfovibrionaceae bacterium]
MAKGVWRLVVVSGFSASHRLRNFKGRCENLHGHNFGVEVEVEGRSLDPETGIVMDFGELKAALGQVLAKLDHRHLNDVDFFRDHNPSSENLALFVYQDLAPRLPQGVRLARVTVSETGSSRASYEEG